MIYDLLAPFYDSFNKEIDYKKWAEFINKIINDYKGNVSMNLGLDLGCGTGNMTFELAKLGYDMTGVDYSDDMLRVAKDKAINMGVDNSILWLCQDMRNFELYGTVDFTVCCLDGINHLIDNHSLDKCLSLVHNYLVPDGLFIFDLNSKYKFENVYSDNSYVMESSDAFCIWQNYYRRKSGLCDFYITLFKERKDGTYDRYDEIQQEKMFTERMIKSALLRNGFEFLSSYADFNFALPNEKSERIYIVAKCKKEV